MTCNLIILRPNLESGLIILFLEGNKLSFYKKFCQEIESRLWRQKMPKLKLYETEDFLKVFFYSEIAG